MRRGTLAGAVALALVGVGCAPTDLVLIGPPEDGGAVDGGTGEAPCATNTDCPEETFCEKERCGAASGRCVKLPGLCANTLAPVCGCDGVTYWNDCERRLRGVQSATAGECQRPRSCDQASPCPPGIACAALHLPRNARCDGRYLGECWALPSVCPEEGPRIESCGGLCVDACVAIKRGIAGRPDPVTCR